MKNEEILKIIEARISDLDTLIGICTRNEKQKEEAEKLNFARNELVLVRDTVKGISGTAESEV